MRSPSMIRALPRRALFALVLISAGLLVPAAAFAGQGADKIDAITGAGAHFAWVIFHDLKPDLERRSGRKIILYGKGSMLGVGCNAGIKLARENRPGHETFGFVCCPLSKKEVRSTGLVVYPIAREPILILVNDSNPVTDLSRAQVRAVFRGDIRNWKQVGGPDEPVVVVTRLHCKQRPGHWKTILPSVRDFRKDRLNVSSAAEMVQHVSDFPGAIGHTGSTWAFNHSDHVKPLRIDGYAPTAANLRSGHYPFYRVLSAVTNGHASADVRGIIREVQTGAAFRRVARKYHLLPLKQ